MGTSYRESLAAFEDAYRKGMAGDQDALRELPALASGLLAQGRDSLATSQEYTDLFYDVDKKLRDAQYYTREQYDAQADMAKTLTAQLEAINAGTAAGEYTGRSVDAIRSELASMKALLAKEKADVTAGGSLSEREALIRAKVNQLNTRAQDGRTDWTAESFLAEVYRNGMTLESWYDRHGRNEGLGVSYDSEAARRALLEDKAALMNSGKTLAPGQTAGGWTAGGVLSAIGNAGMSVDEWNLRYGLGEGVSTLAGGSAASSAPNVSRPASSGGLGFSAGEQALLERKAAAMNAGRTLAEGQTAGGWTAAGVLAAISGAGMSVREWYDRFGRAEGFASGGITPANEPFWVGENGPELMMSPRQYGVLSNPDSIALMDMMRPSPGLAVTGGLDVSGIIDELREVKSYLRQLLSGLSENTAETAKIRKMQRRWDDEGLPATRDDSAARGLPVFALQGVTA